MSNRTVPNTDTGPCRVSNRTDPNDDTAPAISRRVEMETLQIRALGPILSDDIIFLLLFLYFKK